MNEILSLNFADEKNLILSEVYKELKVKNLNEEFFELAQQQKLKMASSIYENADFDSELFSEALNQTFIDLRCLKEEKKVQSQQQSSSLSKKNQIKNLFTKQNYLYQFAFLFIILGLFYIFYRNNFKTKTLPRKFK
eukprot:TRINITY_DN30284_c0_g1_i1.p4 TRINITY_DN30284_c0_g1~~TRINITY_DN30284_c0_g1_i1.p4  ORF type:complete len:136 (-),score=34.73 TRINITY_DN30284_c0_g1_i1:165-572(-)